MNSQVPSEADGRASDVSVAFLTDIPTPYVVEWLRELACRVKLTCLFCSETSTRGMAWNLGDDLGFSYIIVGGMVIRRRDAEGTDYYLSPRIFTRLAKCRPDVVISGGFSFPSLYGAVYCWLFRKHFIIYNDSTSRSEQKMSAHQLFARRVLLPMTSAAVGKSEPAVARLRELGAKTVFLARHTTKLAPLFAVAERRTWLDSGELTLLFVGRLIKRKGADRLLVALSKLPRTSRSVRLIIVGTGPEREALEALAATLGLSNVSFVGFADQTQLPEYYARADAFVFPTLDDPFGIVLLEAAASGLALLGSSRAGATEDFIVDGTTGISFDPNDVECIAGSIAQLANSHQLTVDLGKAAYGAALHRTPSDTADSYVRAIKAVLSRER